MLVSNAVEDWLPTKAEESTAEWADTYHLEEASCLCPT